MKFPKLRPGQEVSIDIDPINKRVYPMENRSFGTTPVRPLPVPTAGPGVTYRTPTEPTKKLTEQGAFLLGYLLGRPTKGPRKGRKTAPKEVTSLIAMTNLGIASLTARVSELRRAGWIVNSAFDKDHLGRRFKRYWMGPKRK